MLKRSLYFTRKFAAAANNLAWLMANQSADLAEALQLAMTAKEAYPYDPYITGTLGWVHYKRGAYGLALSQFSAAVEMRPDLPTLRYHLALALYEDEQTQAAEKELEECLASEQDFPEYEEARQLLTKIRSQRG